MILSHKTNAGRAGYQWLIVHILIDLAESTAESCCAQCQLGDCSNPINNSPIATVGCNASWWTPCMAQCLENTTVADLKPSARAPYNYQTCGEEDWIVCLAGCFDTSTAPTVFPDPPSTQRRALSTDHDLSKELPRVRRPAGSPDEAEGAVVIGGVMLTLAAAPMVGFAVMDVDLIIRQLYRLFYQTKQRTWIDF